MREILDILYLSQYLTPVVGGDTLEGMHKIDTRHQLALLDSRRGQSLYGRYSQANSGA